MHISSISLISAGIIYETAAVGYDRVNIGKECACEYDEIECLLLAAVSECNFTSI